MGDPVTLAVGASIASLGLKAGGDVMKGQGEQSADDFKAAQSERAATYGKLKAQQTDAAMLYQENTQLGNIDAIRAAANTDPTSPTGVAIKQQQEFLSNTNRTTKVDSILAQAQSDTADANYMRSAGDFALNQSYLSAATDVASGLSKTKFG